MGARLGHAASLAAAAPLLLWLNRNQWFFGDEWAFFSNRLAGWGRVLVEPHNEHWPTVPILVYRALWAAVGLRSYLPYAAVLVVLHLATAHLLWRVMNRAGVAPLVATALAAVFAVLGAGSENLLWAFQMGFVGSVAAGLLHVLLVDHAGAFGRRDVAGWGVAVVGLAFSGIGVTMTATVGLVALLRRGVKASVATVAPPAVVSLVWFTTVGRRGLGEGGSTATALSDVTAYAWTGLSSALERLSGVPGAGVVVMLAVLAWQLRQREVLGRPQALATAMALGAVLLFVVVAAGRSGLGVAQATTGRYAYIAAALLLPALGVMLSEAPLGRPGRQLVVVAVLLPVLAHNLVELHRQSVVEAEREEPIRRQIVAAAELVDAGVELAATQPEPTFSPNVTVDLLRQLRREGALPADRVGEVDLLSAATYLQLAREPVPVAPTGTPPSVPVPVDGRGCLVLPPFGAWEVGVAVAAGQGFSVRMPAGGELSVRMRDPRDPSVEGRARLIVLEPGLPEWLRATRDTTLVVRAPGPAAAEVCGVRSG